MRKVLGLQVLKDTKYLSVRTRCDPVYLSFEAANIFEYNEKICSDGTKRSEMFPDSFKELFEASPPTGGDSVSDNSGHRRHISIVNSKPVSMCVMGAGHGDTDPVSGDTLPVKFTFSQAAAQILIEFLDPIGSLD